MSNNKQPVKKLRLGRVSCAIWENEGEHGPRYSVTFERSYMQGEEWQSTNAYGRDDLHLVALLCTEATAWIYRKK